jgi:hypothetical protein
LPLLGQSVHCLRCRRPDADRSSNPLRLGGAPAQVVLLPHLRNQSSGTSDCQHALLYDHAGKFDLKLIQHYRAEISCNEI